MTQLDRNQPAPGHGIEANAQLLNSLLKQLPFPVWIFDTEFNLVLDSGNRGLFAPAAKGKFDPARGMAGLSEILRLRLAECFKRQLGSMHQGWVEIENLGYCYILFHFFPVPGNLMACIPVDLTAAKQVEELLFSSETKYRTLVEAMRDGVWVHNASLVITFCNDGLCRMLGVPRSELIGQSISDLAQGMDSTRLLELIEGNSEIGSQPFEFELATADGKAITASISSTAVTSSTGSGTDYFAVVTDISDQRRVHDALMESERRYRAVAEDQQELICRIDAAGNLLFANQAYRRFVGKTAGQPVSGFFIQTLPEDELAGVVEFIERVRASETWSSVEHRVIMPDGSTRWLQWTARVVSAPEAPHLEIQAVGRDITERKVYYQEIIKYQEQLRAMSAELILAEDRERRRIAAGLHDEIGKALELAAQKLAESGFTGEQTKLNRSRVESRELIEKALESCRNLTFELSPPVQHEEGFVNALEWLVDEIAERHDVRTEFFDDQEPKPMSTDARIQLYQVVRGVLFTLAQHAGVAAIRLCVVQAGAEARIEITWTVSDDPAAGIVSGLLGLDGPGLFSIRERLGQIGGRIESQVGSAGSGSLRFTVPAIAGAGGARAVTRGFTSQPVGTDQPLQRISVLLVDDEVMMREGLRSILLRDPRIEITGETGDGLEALDMAVQTQPDIILLDCSLPGLDSAETLSRMIPVLANTRVLAMSQSRNRGCISKMLKAGAKGFILKESAHQELIEAVEATLADRRYLNADVLETILGDYLTSAERSATVKPSVLTTRELEVLGMLSDGLSTKEIARQLKLSVKTVETHRRRISVKLDISSIAELTKYAIREGVRDLGEQ